MIINSLAEAWLHSAVFVKDFMNVMLCLCLGSFRTVFAHTALSLSHPFTFLPSHPLTFSPLPSISHPLNLSSSLSFPLSLLPLTLSLFLIFSLPHSLACSLSHHLSFSPFHSPTLSLAFLLLCLVLHRFPRWISLSSVLSHRYCLWTWSQISWTDWGVSD